MAEMKKYLDNVALSALVEQIKAEDAKVLAASKTYAENLGVNYDQSGAAATALKDAKDYTDLLANGAVKNNTDAIAKLNGDANTDGSVAKVVSDAKALIDADIDAVEAKADKNAEDIAAINNATTGILAQAKAYTDAEVAKVQGEVDALETYVGTFTHDTAKSVVEYIDAKTAGVAGDASASVSELAGRVTTVEGKVATIEGDYLKNEHKVELEGKITAVETAVANEKARAEEIEGGLRTDINTVMSDYLKATDKSELEGKIDLKADKTALEQEVSDREAAVSGLQTQINTIMNNPDAEGAINSINEFTQYIADHGTIADGFRTDIDKNKDDIAAMDAAYKAADALLAGRLDVLEAIDHDAYVDADTALKNELNAAIALKADATALTAAVEALEAADADQVERIADLEAKFGGADGSVEDMIDEAKQAAIDAAAADATQKADAAEAAAKGHADSLNASMNTRVEALEAIDHDHANKAELDLIVSGDKSKWDEAYAKRHEHANKAELDLIVAGDKAKWDASEKNAKDYADGLNTAMTTKVDGIDARVTKNAEDIATKAAQTDLEAAIERIAKNETDIATNASAIAAFVPVTADEIRAMFA